MADPQLLEQVRPWIEQSLGYALPDPPSPAPTIAAAPDHPGALPFFAVRIDTTVAAAARPKWLDALRPILDDLHPDLLFSVAGSYELSRVTLPDDIAVWGPVPCYVADETTWRPVDDPRSRPLTPADLESVDWQIFWHCARPSEPDRHPRPVEGQGAGALAHFGIYENGTLVALSSVFDHGHNIWEIGVDAAPNAKRRALGSAVVSTAGSWILENGAIPFAGAALWNVPSGRNLRRLGMRYTYSAMLGRPAPFLVPPQPLGEPLPNTPVHDYYPRWAMNQKIIPRPD